MIKQTREGGEEFNPLPLFRHMYTDFLMKI